MKISVVIATYNGEKYLREQLQSILDQTKLPDEVIVTDDGSVDSTESIVNWFLNKAPFYVNYSKNDTNLGYSGNFNKGLLKASGDLVFLCDQDDFWYPEKIERIYEIAVSRPEALLFMNDAALTDKRLEMTGVTKIEQIRNFGLSLDDYVMGCCCALRRQLLNISLPIPSDIKAHDMWVVWIAIGLHSRVIVEEVLQYYRRHGSNESDFVANRLEKPSKLRYFTQLISQDIKSKKNENLVDRISKIKAFKEGLSIKMREDLGGYEQDFLKMHDATEKKLKNLELRLMLRRKNVVRRFFMVIYYYVCGNYADSSGLKSAFRDLLG